MRCHACIDEFVVPEKLHLLFLRNPIPQLTSTRPSHPESSSNACRDLYLRVSKVRSAPGHQAPTENSPLAAIAIHSFSHYGAR